MIEAILVLMLIIVVLLIDIYVRQYRNKVKITKLFTLLADQNIHMADALTELSHKLSELQLTEDSIRSARVIAERALDELDEIKSDRTLKNIDISSKKALKEVAAIKTRLNTMEMKHSDKLIMSLRKLREVMLKRGDDIMAQALDEI